MFRPASRRLVGRSARAARPATRSYSSKGTMGMMHRSSDRQNKAMQTGQLGDMSKQQQQMNVMALKRYAGTLFPGTFVPIPVSKLPKTLGLFSYQFARLRAHFWDFVSVTALRWRSRPSILAFYSKPAAGLYRSQALSAGKALHARLGQALAEGDRDALREICHEELYKTLSAAVDKRKPWERTTWELVQSHGARLASHRVGVMPPPLPANTMIQQAVVAIDTTQSLDRIDSRTGQSVPGAARVQRRTEHLAIVKQWNSETYVAGPWQVIGHVKETTLDGWEKEQADLRAMEAMQTEKKLKEHSKGTQS